ncbi:MAG: helix-turn-helix domain-containing protein [Beutenbergiaceae bacterium]
MGDGAVAVQLRRARQNLGLSQRALAIQAGVPQPNIAAYESGRRTPTSQTLEKLNAVLSVPTLATLRQSRDLIVGAAARRKISNVRVFGSVVHGSATRNSDIDLLVHPAADTSIFDMAGFMSEVEELLGRSVDVISDRGVGSAMERIRAEAVPL